MAKGPTKAPAGATRVESIHMGPIEVPADNSGAQTQHLL